MSPAESPNTVSTSTASDEPDDFGSVDSVIRVRIIENGLQACLYIEPPIKNGAGPTVDSMMAALSNAGVTYNIDMEKLKELEAKPVFYKDVVVATGIPPVNGEDGKAE
ncbi:MAG: flagellar assembly protein A, partial [Oscillospiraceae bacterium]